MKALLFDLFGVFMKEQDAQGRARVEQAARLDEIGVTSADFWAAYKEFRDGLDAGDYDLHGYFTLIAERLGVTFPDMDGLARTDYLSYAGEKPEVIAWLRELAAADRHPALLSNIIEELKDEILRDYDWLGLFEPRIFSCDVRLAKPDPEIFKLAVREINAAREARGEDPVAPQDVLFVDDRPENVDGAAAAGLSGHVFTGLAGARQAVEDFLAAK